MPPQIIQLYPKEATKNMNLERAAHRCRIFWVPPVCQVFVEADYRYTAVAECDGMA